MVASAQDFCQEVKQNRPLINIDPLSFLKGKTKSKATNKSLSANQVAVKAIAEASSKCTVGTGVSQKNVINNVACAKAMGCGDMRVPPGLSSAAQIEWIRAKRAMCDFSGVSQSNSAVGSKQDCVVNTAVNQLLSSTADAAAVAATEKVLEASGMMTEANSLTNNCAVVSNAISAQAAARSIAECYKMVGIGQVNSLSCASRSKQSNAAGNMVQQCIMSAITDQNTSITSKSKGESNLKEDHKASTTASIAASCMCVSCLLFLVIAIRSKGSSGRSDY